MLTKLLELLGMTAALVFWCAGFVWVAIKLEKAERGAIDQKPDHVQIDSDQQAKKHAKKKTNDKCLHG